MTAERARHWLDEHPWERRVVPAASTAVETIRVADLIPIVADGESEARSASALRLVDVSTTPLATTPSHSNFSHTKHLLVVGVDRKPWEKRGGLADTLLFVAIDETTGHAGFLSIPRDFYVDFGGGNLGRINAAITAPARGAERRTTFLKQVVGNLLELPIHSVVIFDLTVLESAIDTVGGVEVIVPCAIADDFVDPRTETGRRILDVPAGTVHMSGVTAAMYARSRHGRTDWDRARRQQAILLGLRRRLTSVEGLSLLPDLLDRVEDHVESDLSRRDLLSLASFAASIEPGKLHGVVIPSAASEGFRTSDGKSVLLPNREKIAEQLNQLFRAASPGTPPALQRCVDKSAALRKSKSLREEEGRNEEALLAATPAPVTTVATP